MRGHHQRHSGEPMHTRLRPESELQRMQASSRRACSDLVVGARLLLQTGIDIAFLGFVATGGSAIVERRQSPRKNSKASASSPRP